MGRGRRGPTSVASSLHLSARYEGCLGGNCTLACEADRGWVVLAPLACGTPLRRVLWREFPGFRFLTSVPWLVPLRIVDRPPARPPNKRIQRSAHSRLGP